MARGKRLAPEIRQLIAKRSHEKSCKEIAAEFEESLRTIQRIIAEYKSGKSFELVPRRKRSCKLSDFDVQVN
jgi:transposase